MNRQSALEIGAEAELHSDDSAHTRRIIGIAQRRESPHFLICDASMNLLFASPEVDLAMSSKETLKELGPACHESRTRRTTIFHAYGSETVLRIVPLGAQLFGCVAIFVDSFSHRGSIFEAARVFGLTKRESEVLQLLVRGTTTADIGNILCIAESTAGDHIKSVMRKTGSSKRVELISKVFNLEQDLAAQQA